MCLFTIYVCVCVCLVYGVSVCWCLCCVGCMHLYKCKSGSQRSIPSVFLSCFPPYFLECESLSLEVTNSTGVGWAGSSRDGNLLVSDSLIWDFRIPNFSYRCWGSKHRSSLCSKHFTTEPSLQSLPFVVLLLCLQIFHQS